MANKGYSAVPFEITEVGLSLEALGLILELRRYPEHKISYRRLKSKLGICTDRVSKGLKELQAMGILKIYKSPRKCNVYSISFDYFDRENRKNRKANNSAGLGFSNSSPESGGHLVRNPESKGINNKEYIENSKESLILEKRRQAKGLLTDISQDSLLAEIARRRAKKLLDQADEMEKTNGNTLCASDVSAGNESGNSEVSLQSVPGDGHGLRLEKRTAR